MSSYKYGQPTGLTSTRLNGNLLLGDRKAVSQFSNRHVNSVRRYCRPLACDVGTRAALYDLDHSVRQLTAMATYLCCIEDNDGNRCGSSVPANAPEAVCQFHMDAIARYWMRQDKVAAARQKLVAQQATGDIEHDRALAQAVDIRAEAKQCVYYLQVGALVKIGFTGDIQRRMMAYPPNSRLLAVEPGGRGLEAKRHSQFHEYLASGKEWFDPGPRLREHIEKMMSQHAIPRTARGA